MFSRVYFYFVAMILTWLFDNIVCDKNMCTHQRVVVKTRYYPRWRWYSGNSNINYYNTFETVYSCCEGYQESQGTCEPICSRGCSNGFCVSPNNCECNEGYQKKGTLCEPLCNHGCQKNSVCTAPNTCSCITGYKLVNDIFCEPICEQNCSEFGKCVSPNQCVCLIGYTMQTEDTSKPLCRPVCSRECIHGMCFQPETCVCDTGYLMGPNNTCTPTCSLGCISSDCIEPEICKCWDGYKLSGNYIHVCEPVCDPACINSDCAAPNTCICWNKYEPETLQSTTTDIGYSTSQDDNLENSITSIMPPNTHICNPVCLHACHNGYCSMPNVCTCNEGYIWNNTNNICSPECVHCLNGYCLTPNECICHTGFEKSFNFHGELCVPIQETTTEETSSETYITSTTNFESATDFVTLARLIETNDGIKLCTNECKCWQKEHRNEPECINICADEFDEYCINFPNCKCNFEKLELICATETGRAETTENILRYRCLEHLVNSKIVEEQQIGMLFYAILYAGVIIVGILIIVMSFIYYYRKKYRDDYVVKFDAKSTG